MYWNRMAPELAVTNFTRSLRFYTEVCGFAVAYQRANPDFAFLDLDTAQLMIEQYEGGWATGELNPPLGRGVNFQIAVDDLQSIYERVKQAGCPLFRDLSEVWYDIGNGKQAGQREFLVQDPDGYLLRFTEALGGESVSNAPRYDA